MKIFSRKCGVISNHMADCLITCWSSRIDSVDRDIVWHCSSSGLAEADAVNIIPTMSCRTFSPKSLRKMVILAGVCVEPKLLQTMGMLACGAGCSSF